MDYLKAIEKATKQIKEKGQVVIRYYRAFEGDIRIIAKDSNDWQYRYTVDFEGNIEEM